MSVRNLPALAVGEVQLNDLMNKVRCIDVLEGLRQLPDESIDEIVSDPPYGLEFMGRDWEWEIGERIRLLHDQKAECRQDGEDNDYWETGIDHCAQCFKWSQEQHSLRDERAQLFEKLITTCGKDRRTIQLARKYLREELSASDRP